MAKPDSDWTINTLLELMNERDRRYEERFIASETARKIYEDSADKWRLAANEWRGAMTDRERNFISRGMGYVLTVLSMVAIVVALAEKLFR